MARACQWLITAAGADVTARTLLGVEDETGDRLQLVSPLELRGLYLCFEVLMEHGADVSVLAATPPTSRPSTRWTGTGGYRSLIAGLREAVSGAASCRRHLDGAAIRRSRHRSGADWGAVSGLEAPKAPCCALCSQAGGCARRHASW